MLLRETRATQGKHGGGDEAQRQGKLWTSTFMVVSVGKDKEGDTGLGLAKLNNFSRLWPQAFSGFLVSSPGVTRMAQSMRVP